MNYRDFSKITAARTGYKLAPIYVFYGPEAFLREKGISIVKGMSRDISDDPKQFRPDTFNTKDFLGELYSVPFFQKRKLVILDLGNIDLTSGSLLKPARGRSTSSERPTGQEIASALEEYLRAPSLFSILVISSEKSFIYSKLSRLIQSNDGLLIECSKMSPYQLVQWVVNEVRLQGKSISSSLAQTLIEKVGNDLSKIDEMLQKLLLLVHTRHAIEPEDLKELVSKDREYVIKELARAILSKNALLALEILKRLLLEGEDVNKIIGYLRGTFKREYYAPEELKLKLGELLNADLSIKTGLMPEDLTLQLLVLKLAQ